MNKIDFEQMKRDVNYVIDKVNKNPYYSVYDKVMICRILRDLISYIDLYKKSDSLSRIHLVTYLHDVLFDGYNTNDIDVWDKNAGTDKNFENLIQALSCYYIFESTHYSHYLDISEKLTNALNLGIKAQALKQVLYKLL